MVVQFVERQELNMAKSLQQDSEGNIINDVETQKNQKGYDNYEADNTKKQREMDAKDAKFKDTVKSGVDKVRGALGFKKGGSVSSASKRADGIAVKGKTRGRIV
jgi:hypothetical protein